MNIDMDSLHADATVLGFHLAAIAGDDTEVEHLLFQALAADEERFGMLSAATLRHVIDNVVAPLLDVTDELQKAGYLSQNMRAGLANARANAERVRGGGR